MTTSPVTTAVIPAAGLGTRFLPATKAVPKEMLPVVDTPAIEYVVREAAAAGLDDVLMITARGKEAMADHFDADPLLEAALEAKGDTERLEAVRRSNGLAQVHQVRQPQPRGLGHAVLCAREHVGSRPFAVMLGDDLIDERDPLLSRMIDAQQALGGSVIALLEVDPAQVHLYGCAAVEPVDATTGAADVGAGDGPDPDLVRVTGLVEKPDPEDAPSNLAVIGRYVLHPAVFDVLERTEPGRGGEIQLTDALATLATMPTEQGGGVHGVVFRGRRYDTGDRLDYLKAVIRLATERPDLGPELRRWLIDFTAGLS